METFVWGFEALTPQSELDAPAIGEQILKLMNETHLAHPLARPEGAPGTLKTVLVKYAGDNESEAYYATGYYMPEIQNAHGGWMTSTKAVSNIIGWREIHE